MAKALCIAAVALVFALTPAAAATRPLTTRLAEALAVPGNAPARSSVIAVDLATGQTLFARNPDTALAPASNEKLVVTYTALVELGASYRFHTVVLGVGSQEGSTWHGNLFLKGYGDPTLSSAGLTRLAVELRKLGIRRVTGRVVGDESWFDSMRTAPGWKSSFYLYESPPLSALDVDRDLFARIFAAEPALGAADRFKVLLARKGITTGAPGVGVAPATATGLAQIDSQPLAAILRSMDRSSDNFTAELVLKTIGAEAGLGGTTSGGVAVVLRDLARANVPLAGLRILDGSGLSTGDRLTAHALSSLLLAAWDNPDVRAWFSAALPVAGRSGTLEDRMSRPPARGVVRAKTGTTNLASALSGYVGDRFAFAVLQNGSPVATWPAREAQDRFATTLASVSAGQ